ncbi:MAG: glycogen-binding domain-containing protein [Treponema sp.]|nr:glycogen-binding domain-containing protein [Treponema sp.]
MKMFITSALLILIIGNIGASDTVTYQFIDYLRGLSAPGRPEIFGNRVIFTASSSHQRVGVAFAHEGFARVHWFRHLLLPGDRADLAAADRDHGDFNVDSGIMFHIAPIPAGIQYLDYRLVIDGLWAADPLNPLVVRGASGIALSRLVLPAHVQAVLAAAQPGTFQFKFRAPPGETVTVAGSFNNWDPFMYELRETSPGLFTLTLPLPAGRFQYVFFHRGEQIPDPANMRRLYTREGRVVSEAIVY